MYLRLAHRHRPTILVVGLGTGILYDREWMVVKDDTGRFVSQREKSELALVRGGCVC